MSSHRHVPLLLDYFNNFPKDHDKIRFRASVECNYSQTTLSRLIQSSADVCVCRASMPTLALIGAFESNNVLAKALYDPDQIVRRWTDRALWTLWFCESTSANNAQLQKVAQSLSLNKPTRAISDATSLIHHLRKPTTNVL